MNPVRTELTTRDVTGVPGWGLGNLRGRRTWDTICVVRIIGAALIFVSLDLAFSWLVFVGVSLMVLATYAAALHTRRIRDARTAAIISTLSGTYTLDESGVRIEVDSGATHFYPWDSLAGVVATPGYIYLKSSPVTTWIVPRRCFISADEAEEFLAYARGHVGRAEVPGPS